MSEFDGDQPVVTQCHITRIWKNGYSPMRNEFASVRLRVGECQIGATLLLNGSLKLPGDVRIPADLRQRVTREAQHLALRELVAEWRMQRDVDDAGRFIVGDA